MTQEQIDEFRDRLLEERNRLLENIRTSDDHRAETVQPSREVSTQPTRAADHDAEGLEKQVTRDQTIRHEWQAVDMALARTQDGTYGNCQRCGSEISQERLEVIPYAPFCVRWEHEVEGD